jgi:DNA repair exonuclease SbcCD ATPase subunit|nr:MAG TPA: chromosome partition protein [Caudoviricetes sp.]
MKKIILSSITLTNWRGEKNRTTNFNIDAPTYILGANGLGKSRHFDAFCWLLFGKDSHDRKDFELRSYDANHQPLHHCECSVSAVIIVDGVKHTIKREYQEQWVKPKGQPQEVFKGNVTVCTWDDVPVKVSDYQKRVSDIIDETVFKMVTNPAYFAEKMKWQLQRETLMQMAGQKSDKEIAQGNADFETLLDTLNGKSLSDFRKQLAMEKKRLKEELNGIQPRIDQTQKLMPEAENWTSLTEAKEAYDEKIKGIDAQLEDSAKIGTEQRAYIDDLNKQIDDLRAQQRKIVDDATEKANKNFAEKNRQRTDIETKLRTGNAKLSQLNIDLGRNADRVKYLKAQIEQTSYTLDTLRDGWRKINASEYDGSTVCPHCGQPLPEHMIASAKEDFAKHKAELLADNCKTGKAFNAQMKSFKEEVEKLNVEAQNMETEKTACERTINDLYAELDKCPRAEQSIIVKEELPEWNKLQEQIASIQDEITDVTSKPKEEETMRDDLRRQKEELLRQQSDLMLRLAKKEQIAEGNKEIERLEQHGKDLAQQIADIEHREFIAQQFSHKKIEDCKQRINSMFQYVTFQLFDYTLDGGEIETCVPLISGVPYGVANTASRINAGLDIINTLCRFNNVSAPIFCDGAESVNTYIPTLSQMIFLQVTTDEQLIIK